MESILHIFEQHGLVSLFLGVLVEQLGAPIPALPFLLLAGAQAAADGLFGLQALGAATAASAIADAVWFFVGRRYGRSVLDLLCRLSLSPNTCIQKSELSFARRGITTLLFAKFIPGVSTLAPPLAGALGMNFGTFLLADLAGTALWAGCGLAAGRVFHDEVNRLTTALENLGSTAMVVLVGSLGLYVLWRGVRRLLIQHKHRATPSLSPHDVAKMIDRGERLVIVDVRLFEPTPLARIPGAVRAPLNEDLPADLATIAEGVRVITYCDCPDDASAAKLARKLAQPGRPAYVLAGGLSAWAAAGLPVET
jgi:membrane protein DedA with SNARE-associated domain/rhodanese-related sulfurtransferase